MNLTYLTDKSLLEETKILAHQYRKVTTKLLYHLKEIERRKLFCELGYSSVFDYTVRELGFSEASAARRIRASRLLAEIPEIESKIEQGSLNLSNVSMAAQCFKEKKIKSIEKKKEILERLENLSSRECKKALCELLPPKEFTVPLKITLSEKEYDLYKELQAHLAHCRDFWEKIFHIALKELNFKRYEHVPKKMKISKDPRYISAKLRQEIFKRDKVCQKCGGKFALQIDHRRPFALGGKTEAENLRLLCRNCNQRERIKAKLY